MNIDELNALISRMEKRSVQIGLENRGKILPPRSARLPRHCVDCDCVVELFMVHDAVWKAAGFDKHDLGCQSCLEKRLNRPLTIEDFSTAIANINIFRAYRLALNSKDWLCLGPG